MNQEIGYSVLSDVDIKRLWNGPIKISSPGNESVQFSKQQIRNGSIDLHFARAYKKIKLNQNEVLTYDMIAKHNYTTPYEIEGTGKLHINPGEMILTTTLETVILGAGIAGFLSGRSSIARLGIMVHCAQSYINPGHGNPIPLQLVNLAPCAVELDLDTPVCQLVLVGLNTPASISYRDDPNSKYISETSGSKDSMISSDYSKCIVHKTTRILRSTQQ